jgi:hypothetical protein
MARGVACREVYPVPVPALGPLRRVVPVRIAGRGGRRTARRLWLMRNIRYPVGVHFLHVGRMFRVDSRLSRRCERMGCRGACPAGEMPGRAGGSRGGCPAWRAQPADARPGGSRGWMA